LIARRRPTIPAPKNTRADVPIEAVEPGEV